MTFNYGVAINSAGNIPQESVTDSQPQHGERRTCPTDDVKCFLAQHAAA